MLYRTTLGLRHGGCRFHILIFALRQSLLFQARFALFDIQNNGRLLDSVSTEASTDNDTYVSITLLKLDENYLVNSHFVCHLQKGSTADRREMNPELLLIGS
jgi:hypothetical protein